jgi:hypothetical protein
MGATGRRGASRRALSRRAGIDSAASTAVPPVAGAATKQSLEGARPTMGRGICGGPARWYGRAARTVNARPFRGALTVVNAPRPF